jgi:hypothetical protein
LKRLPNGMCLCAALVAALVAAPLYGANRSVLPKRAVVPSRYDISKEVTLQATVQSVHAKPGAGRFGGYLTLSTAHGTAEAQVGRFLLRGPGAVSFTPGEQVKLVGLMATLNHRQVLLTRLIVAGGRTITVRNHSGFLVPPGGYLHGISTTGGAR